VKLEEPSKLCRYLHKNYIIYIFIVFIYGQLFNITKAIDMMLFKLSDIPFEFQASNLMAFCYKPMGKPKNVNV
jgi:hypothetical protein